MTMTPIKRIPLEGFTESQIINDPATTPLSPGDALMELGDHTGDQEAISDTLDWAMQLRDRTGRSWGNASLPR